jgi:hypothetical protein
MQKKNVIENCKKEVKESNKEIENIGKIIATKESCLD